ncbi:MAG: membrane protein insertase YidC [Actinobacteria bacterium]|nr:membrane protein insertase YidC [Actinomycetota bacterium]
MLDALASPVGYLLAYIHTGLSTFLISSSGPAWALSIVLLTVTVRLLLFPLFVKQIKSQRRMQELAPKVKELQKLHKGDRETLNVEMMKLYKENNANPISGCLPLLLQLPVFFALFTVIREFRTTAGSGRFGLSREQLIEGAQAKVFGAPISAVFNSPAELIAQLDASHTTVRLVAAIMVVLMGATTFWTQRQMIARSGTTDPQQIMVQKLLLYVLPLSFAVSGVFFPIGVLLYWLTTNVWSMGQQAWVIKRMPPPNLGAADAGPKGVSLSKEPPGGKGPQGPKGKGPKGKGPQGKGPQAAKSKPESPKGGSPNGGDPDPAGRSVPAGVGGRAAAGAAKAPAPRQGNRASAGSRKNKNRRGGRR